MIPSSSPIEAPRTIAAKQEPNRVKRFLKILGPGLITGASDDDPSGIITYAQAGARFGLVPLWTALFTFPLMTAVQYICSKIGLVTGKGLAGVMRHRYPRWVMLSSMALLVIANTINAGADIGAIASGIHLIAPIIPVEALIFPVTILLVIVLIKGSYERIASLFRWLTLALFAYILSSLFTHPNWWQVLKHTLIPEIRWDFSFLSMLVAILGTTISPYLFFWQTEAEVEEQRKTGLPACPGATNDDLKYAALDVGVGMLFSNVVMYFIILATASALHTNGKMNISTAADAAVALRPVGGDFASWLFAAGLIGTGLLAVPILVGSSAYAISTCFAWKRGLSEKWYHAREFYAVIAIATGIGMELNFFRISSVAMLYWTAVLNGLLAPPLLMMIMFISNDRKIMGDKTNSLMINILGWTATFVMTLAAAALLFSLFQK